MRAKIIWSLLCGLLSLWVAAAASAHGRLPAGTPYAAEISVTLTYNGTFTKQESFQTDCTGADGSDVTQSIDETQKEHIDRTIVFKHVTVPVVARYKLGRAARRLALKPTVTDDGAVTRDDSTYLITGTQADDSTCPQTITSYTCDGLIKNVGNIVSVISAGEDGFKPDAWVLPAYSLDVSDPLGCDGAGQPNVAEQLGITAGQGADHWQEVALVGNVSSHFYALRSRRQVVFSWPVISAHPCDESDALSCAQSATGSAQISLKRRFLYRTRKSYVK